jgi:P27 family predicted phage terminase small subunit
MRGPKPKPVEQRIREGNAGHRPLPEPLLIGGRPTRHELAEPPGHLSDPAKEFWKESVETLVNVGVADRVDRPVLEMLATEYANWRYAGRVLQQDGFFVRGSVGQIREHPALKIQGNASDRFLKIAEQYGLTPIARTRLGLAELHRRSLADELNSGLAKPKLRPAGVVDSTVEEELSRKPVIAGPGDS